MKCFSMHQERLLFPNKKKKALSLLRMKREKLMKECKIDNQPNDGRGSHSREAGCLRRLRALSYDCLQLIPKEGCMSVTERAEYWTKIELMNESLQKMIKYAGEWDNLNQIDLQSSSSNI